MYGWTYVCMSWDLLLSSESKYRIFVQFLSPPAALFCETDSLFLLNRTHYLWVSNPRWNWSRRFIVCFYLFFPICFHLLGHNFISVRLSLSSPYTHLIPILSLQRAQHHNPNLCAPPSFTSLRSLQRSFNTRPLQRHDPRVAMSSSLCNTYDDKLRIISSS